MGFQEFDIDQDFISSVVLVSDFNENTMCLSIEIVADVLTSFCEHFTLILCVEAILLIEVEERVEEVE